MYHFQLATTILLFVAALATADESGCGGLLLGEYGRFQYPANQSQTASTVSTCLWTVLLPSGADIKFTLDTLSPDSQLVLYPEQNPTRRALSSVTLNSFDVGRSVEFKGRTLIVILPNVGSDLSFTWESLSENESKVVVAANYIDTTDGSLEWRQRRPSERLTYVVSADDSTMISYRTTLEPYSCQSEDPCQCFYFGIFEVAPSGSLTEAGRICGETPSEGTLAKSTSQVVAVVYANAELSALNKVEISWQSHPSGTTETTTSTTASSTTTTNTTSTAATEPPPDDAVGILAATPQGLVAISLDTFNATVISTPQVYGVTFDTKRSKVIWSESGGTIKRAFTNGTEIEILKTGAGSIYSIEIDTLTENVYYADFLGDHIMVCNSEIDNCAALSTVPETYRPLGIALDIPHRQIYWTNNGVLRLHSVTKANLDGWNATEIIRGLNYPEMIVVDSDGGRIYWTSSPSNSIETSDLEGGGRRVLVAFSGKPGPKGLAMYRDLLYVGNYGSTGSNGNVQRMDKYTGDILTTVYFATTAVWEVAVIDSGPAHYSAADNLCEGNSCSHLCVPNLDSYRCLCPENMYLEGNHKTCLYLK